MLKSKFPFYLILLAVLFSCAKRGRITGGEKDTTPPVITSSSPKNFSTGFTGNFIKINFNEYIKVKDINKQLIISPPMKHAPEIVPMGSASKFITIKLKDTLQPNTTYSFNFGQSISDNNEGNPYSQFKYVFSTGATLDSLKLGGTIRDAKSQKTDNFVSVLLYETSKFNDSTVYKKQPHYVTNTLDSLTTFVLENLKEGNYQLIALKDENKNYRFDPKTDKIAFFKNPVKVPNDTLYKLELFKEVLPFNAEKPKQASGNRLIVGHQGKAKNIVVSVKEKGSEIPVMVTKFENKDSLQLWVPKIKGDSLQIKVSSNAYSKSFSVKTKEMKTIDTLSFKTKQTGLLNFRDSFTIVPSTPLVKIDNSKIRIIKKDSTEVAFTTKYKEWDNELVFDFKKEEDQRYAITALPGALKDFYEKENDTLTYSVSTKKLTDYGNLTVSLENVNRFPILVELLDKDENVMISQYSEKQTAFTFETLEPKVYTLRIIYDDNKDGEWTTGSYLEKRLPEEVIYFPKGIDVRANWDVEQPFILSK